MFNVHWGVMWMRMWIVRLFALNSIPCKLARYSWSWCECGFYFLCDLCWLWLHGRWLLEFCSWMVLVTRSFSTHLVIICLKFPNVVELEVLLPTCQFDWNWLMDFHCFQERRGELCRGGGWPSEGYRFVHFSVFKILSERERGGVGDEKGES